MTPFLGEIRLLPYSFAPLNWRDCDGSELNITDYTTLYTLLGTTYGGNGVTTFCLPDLRGRVPIHQGTGQGTSTYVLGQISGNETVTLTANQLPAHSHPFYATTALATTAAPGNTTELAALNSDYMYTSDITGSQSGSVNPAMIGSSGGNGAHDNIMPTIAVRYCIAVEGIFPSRG